MDNTNNIKASDIQFLKYRIDQYNTAQSIRKQEIGLLPNLWSAENQGMYRQRFYPLQGNETGLDTASREQVVRLSRELFFKLPIVCVASEFKAKYVVGNHWNFVYKNLTKTKWKQEAENFINKKWYSNCFNRGFAYDFKTVLKVMSRTIDMDGDFLQLFVKGNDGWPLLQVIGGHRIGSNTANVVGKAGVNAVINGKEYRVLDGIVYDEMDRPIAYSIKRDDAQIATVPPAPKVETKDTIISADNAQLVFNPIVFDKGRGLPALYSSVLYGLQMEDLDNFLMDIAKLEATIAYVVQNDAGQAPQEYENLLNEIQNASLTNNISTLPSIAPTIHAVNVVKGPTARYIKSEGGDIKSFVSQRPGEEIQQYQRTIETKLCAALGWPHQLIYSPETISGRTVNAVQQFVRKNVSERQETLKKYAKLAVVWALSVAMEEGIISKNYDDDISEFVDFVMPPEFTLDQNDDNKQNSALYTLGLLSGEEFCVKNDMNFNHIQEKRNQEINDLLTNVEAMKKQFPNISEAAILNLFTQRGQSTLKIEDNQENSEPITKPTNNNL